VQGPWPGWNRLFAKSPLFACAPASAAALLLGLVSATTPDDFPPGSSSGVRLGPAQQLDRSPVRGCPERWFACSPSFRTYVTWAPTYRPPIAAGHGGCLLVGWFVLYRRAVAI